MYKSPRLHYGLEGKIGMAKGTAVLCEFAEGLPNFTDEFRTRFPAPAEYRGRVPLHVSANFFIEQGGPQSLEFKLVKEAGEGEAVLTVFIHDYLPNEMIWFVDIGLISYNRFIEELYGWFEKKGATGLKEIELSKKPAEPEGKDEGGTLLQFRQKS